MSQRVSEEAKGRRREGVRRYHVREGLKKSIAHDKRLIEFHERELQLLNRIDQLGGEEGVKKRLDELKDVAKEIDELRKTEEILTRYRSGPYQLRSLSLDKLRQYKRREIEHYKSVLKKNQTELQKLLAVVRSDG